MLMAQLNGLVDAGNPSSLLNATTRHQPLMGICLKTDVANRRIESYAVADTPVIVVDTSSDTGGQCRSHRVRHRRSLMLTPERWNCPSVRPPNSAASGILAWVRAATCALSGHPCSKSAPRKRCEPSGTKAPTSVTGCFYSVISRNDPAPSGITRSREVKLRNYMFLLEKMARPERFERPTLRFVV